MLKKLTVDGGEGQCLCVKCAPWSEVAINPHVEGQRDLQRLLEQGLGRAAAQVLTPSSRPPLLPSVMTPPPLGRAAAQPLTGYSAPTNVIGGTGVRVVAANWCAPL